MPRFSAACTSGAERAPLGETDVLVARGRPVPAVRDAALRPQLLGQQRAQQSHRQFAGRDAFLAFRVLVHHGVEAGLVEAARLAEGDVFTGDVLQLERHVFEHVTEPGAFVLVHAADETAGLLVGAAVLGKAGQGLDQAADEGLAELGRRPGLQFAEVELQPDDREAGVVGGADVDGAVEDAHAGRPLPAKG
jgi:hypothetical protein